MHYMIHVYIWRKSWRHSHVYQSVSKIGSLWRSLFVSADTDTRKDLKANLYFSHQTKKWAKYQKFVSNHLVDHYFIRESLFVICFPFFLHFLFLLVITVEIAIRSSCLRFKMSFWVFPLDRCYFGCALNILCQTCHMNIIWNMSRRLNNRDRYLSVSYVHSVISTQPTNHFFSFRFFFVWLVSWWSNAVANKLF